jgi:hypothetical protein
LSDKKTYETEGNLVNAFVAAKVFPKNVVEAAVSVALDRMAGNKDGKSLDERLDEAMTRHCELYATKKRIE